MGGCSGPRPPEDDDLHRGAPREAEGHAGDIVCHGLDKVVMSPRDHPEQDFGERLQIKAPVDVVRGVTKGPPDPIWNGAFCCLPASREAVGRPPP